MTADHRRRRRRSIFRECLPFTPPPVSKGIEQASNGSERAAKAEDEAKGGWSVVSGQNSGPKKSTLAAQKTIHVSLTYQDSVKPSMHLRT